MIINYKKQLTKEFLIKYYNIQHLTSYDIAQKIGCCQYTVWKYLKYFGLNRNNSEKQIGKYNHRFKIYPKKYCKDCGKLLGKRAYYWKHKRCWSCSQSYKLRNPKDNPAYIDGRSLIYGYSAHIRKQLRQIILKRDRYRCQYCRNCNIKYLNINKIVLHVHHIDYNKKNNSLDNLITLCNSCHTKTNHNRTYWKKYYQALMKTNI